MKFLIADDNATNRLVLAAMLKKDGHDVIVAEDGKQAVEAYERAQPDMVIMDVMMPVMSGYEATTWIKAHCGDRFVPVIFLTALTDEHELADCIRHGGDDFLTKPVNQTILKSKIDALARIRDLHVLVREQNIKLAAHHARIEQEQRVARSIFDSILGAGSLQDPALKCRISPAAVLSGDFLLAARRPNGSLHLLLGDMTGHGLSAVVGALPLADAFYAMTHRGYAIDAIAATMNRKVNAILPPGMFCAACLLEWDDTEGRLGVWNGGLPDVLVTLPGRGIVHRFVSRHLPLGIRNPAEFDGTVEFIAASADSRVYLYSDGLIEHENPAGEPFGQERLDACFAADVDPTHVFETIEERERAFTGGTSAHDDVTIVEVRATPTAIPQRASRSHSPGNLVPSTPWRLGLELSAGTLTRLDPLPEILRLLNDFQGFADHRDAICTILTELVNNAVDYGLLGLDSAQRNTPEGFSEYYAARAQRLKALTTGFIRIDLSLEPLETGGRFTVRVQDSGPGFDWRAKTTAMDHNRGYSGRGIPLLKSLCEQVRYEGNGNTVEAVYAWV